jgi:hypothetical protein
MRGARCASSRYDVHRSVVNAVKQEATRRKGTLNPHLSAVIVDDTKKGAVIFIYQHYTCG